MRRTEIPERLLEVCPPNLAVPVRVNQVEAFPELLDSGVNAIAGLVSMILGRVCVYRLLRRGKKIEHAARGLARVVSFRAGLSLGRGRCRGREATADGRMGHGGSEGRPRELVQQ